MKKYLLLLVMMLSAVLNVFAQSQASTKDGATLTSSLVESVVSANEEGADFQFSVSMDLGTTSFEFYGADKTRKSLQWTYDEFPNMEGVTMIQSFTGKDAADTAVTFHVGEYGTLELFGFDGDELIVSIEVIVKSIQEEGNAYIINDGELNLAVGDKKELTLYYSGAKFDGEVMWDIIADNIVAEISEGVVSALAEGSCTIVAKVDKEIVATAPCTIVSISLEGPIYTLNAEKLNLYLNEMFLLELSKDGELYEGTIEWTAINRDEDNPVAVVAEDGYVTGVGIGEARVEAKVEGEVVASITVVVEYQPAIYVLSPETFEIEVGASQEMALFTVEGAPLEWSDPIEWFIENPKGDGDDVSVAFVEEGVVTGENPGTAEVIAWSNGEILGRAFVTVVAKKDYTFKFEQETYEIMAGQSANLSLFMSDDLKDFTFNVMCENADLTVSVGQNRTDIVVYSEIPGEYEVVAMGEYGGEKLTASVMVVVNKKVTYNIEEESYELTIGDRKTIVLYADEAEYEGDIEWNISMDIPSDNPIAAISNGAVYALAEGTGIIEAKVDGEVVATATLTISKFSGAFIAADTVFCQGSEGKVSITCTNDYNTDLFSVMTASGGPVDIEFDIDETTVLLNYANLSSGEYSIQYAGSIVSSFTVVVADIPTVRISVNPENVYTNDEVTFAATVTSDDIESYSWLIDGNAFEEQTVTYTFENADTYAISCSVTSIYGCKSEEETIDLVVNKKVSYRIGEGKYALNVGETEDIVLYADEEEYAGEIEWNIAMDTPVDNPIAAIDGGIIYAFTEGSGTIEAKVDGEVVATAALTISKFSGAFIAADTVFCQGSEGKVTLTCTEEYNTDLVSVMEATGAPVDIEFDESTIIIDYANLTSGVYAVSYAGMQVATFEVVVNEVPEIEIVSIVDSYVVGTEYQFGVQLLGDSESTEGVEYKWEVIDETNPESRDNMDYTHGNSSLFVTFFAEGNYTINCEPMNGFCQGEMVSMQVNVAKKVTYQIGEGKYLLNVGETKQLTLYADEEEYFGDDVEWNILGDGTTEEVIAEISDGVVSALSEGVCTIEAKIGGTVVATAALTIVAPIQLSFHLEAERFEMNVGDEKELVLYVNDEVYDGEVEWKVDDYDGMVIGEIDAYGYLHANYEGTTTVYAIIDTVVAKATVTFIYTGGGTSKSIGFTEPGYSVMEGETMEMCLELYGFNPGYEIKYEFSQEGVVSSEFNYNLGCFMTTGLAEGRTALFVTLIDGEDTYTASAALDVMAKEIETPIVHFEQDVYRLAIGEEITANIQFEQDIMIPEDDQMQVSVDDNSVAEVSNFGNYYVTLKGVQEGETSVLASIYDGKYTAKATIVVKSQSSGKEELPEPLCEYDNNTMTVCFGHASDYPDGYPLERMVYTDVDLAGIEFQWYNASGEALEKAPVVSATQVGSFTYYVSLKGSPEFEEVSGISYTESKAIPVTINITYIPTPTINMYDQKICNGQDVKPFVVNEPKYTEAYWYNEEWEEVATGAEFLPTDVTSGKHTYMVVLRDTNWCESKELQVTLVNGSVEIPEVSIRGNEFAPSEEINMVAKPTNDNTGIIWSVNNEVFATGFEASTKFSEVGEYNIVCKAVDQSTGCSVADTQKVIVKEVVIPVEAIEVVTSDYEMYVGESAMIEYRVIPEYATNKDVTIRYTTEGTRDAAVVRGMKISAMAEGTEMIIISSAENPDITAECNVTVRNLVKGTGIVMPSQITLNVGEETSVNVVVTPSNATYNQVYFKEKEDDIISVSIDGNVTAKSAGTSTISAYTEEGLYATATVYVVEETKTITKINVPTEIVLKKGESKSVPFSVEPVSLAIKEISWTMDDETIASFENGILTANKVGQFTLTASIAGVSNSTRVVVNNSDAPTMNFPVSFSAPTEASVEAVKALSLGQASIDFSEFISDDSTTFDGLKIAVTTNPTSLGVTNNGSVYVFDGNGFEGPATINVSVTDNDGLSSTGSFILNFVKETNKAPEILVDTLVVKYGTPSYFELASLAKDDFTMTSQLDFTFGTTEGIATKVSEGKLVVEAGSEAKEFNNLDMKVVDAYGEEATKTLVVNVASMPNKAPVIAVVPNQLENDTIAFGTFKLNEYVSDDYTAPSDIVWSVTSSENIAVRIVNGVATVKVLNEFWNGAEVITFTATDEEGLSTSVDVYYIRSISQETYEQQKTETNSVATIWEGAPTVSIMTMRQIGVPNQEFVLMANISSFDCTWEWIIDGADGIDQTSMLQAVTFKNPGMYSVKLKVMSADGEHVVNAELPVQLAVVGIENHDISICQGDAVELNAIGDVNSLLWSTDEMSSSISVRPAETTKYTLTMKKGMFTMVDEVIVNVSVPVSLMEDSVMCAGTEFSLEAQGEFESYSWNTGATSKSIVIPAEVASYIVYATDANNCMSVDTFNITKVNELPVLDIAKDAELNPCDGTEVTLNAGAGYAEYAWTITQGKNAENKTAVETITIDTTSTVAATVVDANGCIGQQEVTVNFKYPYAEQLGVATFSETTDHIILAWEKTLDVNTVKYRIERETGTTDNWEQVGDDVMFDEPGLIVDEDVNYKQRAYKYRLVTTDGCNNEAVSEVHRSMIATYHNQDNGLKTIQWCAYEPMSMITQYLILRGTDVTAMDTVDEVPASNLFEIWNEVDPQFKNVKEIKYRVVFRLKDEVNETKYNTLSSLDSKEVDEQMLNNSNTLKAESGPFALALSNIAEAENTTDIDVVPFADVVVYPTAVTNVINVAIASDMEKDFEIEVVNTNGQSMSKVHTGAISKAIIQIPAEGFAQGLYNVKISDGTQTKAFKVTK